MRFYLSFRDYRGVKTQNLYIGEIIVRFLHFMQNVADAEHGEASCFEFDDSFFVYFRSQFFRSGFSEVDYLQVLLAGFHIHQLDRHFHRLQRLNLHAVFNDADVQELGVEDVIRLCPVQGSPGLINIIGSFCFSDCQFCAFRNSGVIGVFHRDPVGSAFGIHIISLDLMRDHIHRERVGGESNPAGFHGEIINFLSSIAVDMPEFDIVRCNPGIQDFNVNRTLRVRLIFNVFV